MQYMNIWTDSVRHLYHNLHHQVRRSENSPPFVSSACHQFVLILPSFGSIHILIFFENYTLVQQISAKKIWINFDQATFNVNDQVIKSIYFSSVIFQMTIF